MTRIKIPLNLVLQGIGVFLGIISSLILISRHPFLVITAVISYLLVTEGDRIAEYLEDSQNKDTLKGDEE